jgi:ABC-type glycerol-3-phosphate transport system permease component
VALDRPVIDDAHLSADDALIGGGECESHAQMAAAWILATVRALLLMFVGQRFIMAGLTPGSVK